MSLFSKIVPRGLRKLTWKKVGKALPFVAGAAALALPGVGTAVAAGVAKGAGKLTRGAGRTAATIGSIAKSATSAAGEIAQDALSSREAIDRARAELAADSEAFDRALHGPAAYQVPAFFQNPATIALLVGGALVLILALRRK